MDDAEGLTNVLVFLTVIVVTVPLARALRVSPVLGYLVAGVVLGPSGLGVIDWTERLQGLAEVGVLFLLFATGLDLSFDRLVQLRRYALGLGVGQLGLTGLALAVLTSGAFDALPVALVVGFSLAMSSTAIVVQLLRERGELARRHGRASLAVLLLQDVAVVPLLVAIGVLARSGEDLAGALGTAALTGLFAVAGILAVGRLALRPLYHRIASLRSAEALLSLTLLVALGSGWATQQLGLSMALGAFLAGVLVAETEYRHQVEADLEPFRSLLLGLFFLGVGLSIDLDVVVGRAPTVLGLAIAVVVTKAVLLFVLARANGLVPRDAAPLALGLAQSGEFGFVALTLAQEGGLLAGETGSLLRAMVAVTMFATPGLLALGHRLGGALEPTRPDPGDDGLEAEARGLEGHVVIAGCGRVGETVARVLTAHGVPAIGLEIDPGRVVELRARGLPVFVGDASRPQVLERAGIERASAAVVTLDQPEAAERICAVLRRGHTHLPVLARARNREHGGRLLRAGATAAVPETLAASLELAGRVLAALEITPDEIDRTLDELRADDYAQLEAWRVSR
jgi:CPA2 family monovalent cation:H+ antiporter-2